MLEIQLRTSLQSRDPWWECKVAGAVWEEFGISSQTAHAFILIPEIHPESTVLQI